MELVIVIDQHIYILSLSSLKNKQTNLHTRVLSSDRLRSLGEPEYYLISGTVELLQLVALFRRKRFFKARYCFETKSLYYVFQFFFTLLCRP